MIQAFYRTHRTTLFNLTLICWLDFLCVWRIHTLEPLQCAFSLSLPRDRPVQIQYLFTDLLLSWFWPTVLNIRNQTVMFQCVPWSPLSWIRSWLKPLHRFFGLMEAAGKKLCRHNNCKLLSRKLVIYISSSHGASLSSILSHVRGQLMDAGLWFSRYKWPHCHIDYYSFKRIIWPFWNKFFKEGFTYSKMKQAIYKLCKKSFGPIN